MATQSVRPRRRRRNDGSRKLVNLWETFAASPAQITEEQIRTIEKIAQEDDGIRRRMALATLAFSGAELIEKFGAGASREAAETAAWFMTELDDFEKRLGSLREMVQSASVRVGLALAEREDMKDVLATAETAAAA